MLAVLSLRPRWLSNPILALLKGASVSTLDSGLLGTLHYGLCILPFSSQGLAQSRHLVGSVISPEGCSSRHSFLNSDCCLFCAKHFAGWCRCIGGF